jgi:hypothetical protein
MKKKDRNLCVTKIEEVYLKDAHKNLKKKLLADFWLDTYCLLKDKEV